MPTADHEGRVTKLLDLLAKDERPTAAELDARIPVQSPRPRRYGRAAGFAVRGMPWSSSRPTAGELEATKLLAKGKSKSNERPTTAELETWMGAGECPDVAKDEALALLGELLGLELRGPLRIVNGESLACRKAYYPLPEGGEGQQLQTATARRPTATAHRRLPPEARQDRRRGEDVG